VATLGCTLSNSGFVGYPILLLALPMVARQAFAMNVLVENIVVLPLSLVLMSLDASGNAEGRWQALRRILLSTLRRPLILALLIGLPVKLSGLALPLPVTRLFELLGHAGAPLALFYIGGSLAGLALSGNRALAAQIVAIKLIVHPAIVALALAGYRLAGGVLAPELAGALLLTAAAPMLGTYAVFAAEKGHQGMASIALLGATVAAFFTNSALLALLV
jgi:malonate transporter